MKRKLVNIFAFTLLVFLFGCPLDDSFEFSSSLYKYVEPSQMVLVPTGPFAMGSDFSEGPDFLEGISDEGFSDERPERQVYLDGFFMDITEVTNAQYRACVAKGACADPQHTGSLTREGYYLDSDFDLFPVIFVSYHQAQSYCQWAGKRLPTEAQWEKAARGQKEFTYPWGDHRPDCTMSNFSKMISEYDETGEMVFSQTCFGDTVKVDQYPSYLSPYGIYNMAGNVAEWVSDWYLEQYYDSGIYPDNLNNPQGPGDGKRRVYRGGGFANNMYLIRTAFRSHGLPGSSFAHVGFRCAKDEND